MFPVLERVDEALALAQVGFRSMEAVFLITIEAEVLTLVDLGRDLDDAGATGGGFQAIGDSLLAETDQTFALHVLVSSVGAMVFHATLHQMRLVPRWLFIWGLASRGRPT
jgi:hypothetical protein